MKGLESLSLLFQRQFYLDTRSLALMRMATALLLLFDLFSRWPFIKDFYTDQGFLPRNVLLDNFKFPKLSFHIWGGDVGFIQVLFVLAAVFAFCLFIGYQTKLSSFISWLLFVSLYQRNPLIVGSSDAYFLVILFWGMFLPWGNNLSYDVYRQTSSFYSRRIQEASVITFAFIVQISIIYWFTGFMKSGAQWQDGTAVYYALQLEQFTKPLGFIILNYPQIMVFLTFAVYFVEAYGPFLFFVPFASEYLRFTAIFLLIIMHLGVMQTMELGLFHIKSITALVGLMPSFVWGRRFVGQQPSILDKMSGAAKWGIHLIVGFALVYIILWNTSLLSEVKWKIPQSIKWVGETFCLKQRWTMFAPKVSTLSGWFVFEGRSASGNKINLYDPMKEVSFEKPDNVMKSYPNYYYWKYLERLKSNPYKKYRPYYAQFLCRQIRDSHGKAYLEKVRVYFISQRTLLNNEKTLPKKKLLIEHSCSKN